VVSVIFISLLYRTISEVNLTLPSWDTIVSHELY